jgi:chromosome partitioning protein
MGSRSRAGRLPAAPVVAVVGRKGGVGKTTAACEIAAAVARQGRTVLVIDYDPSANATLRLGLLPEPGLASLILGRDGALPLGDLAVASPWMTDGRLLVVPASSDLASVSEDMRPSWPIALQRALDGVGRIADLVVVDTGPSRGRLGYQALVAATWILAVTTGEEDAVNALAAAIDEADEVDASGLRREPGPKVAGIVVAAAPLDADGMVRMVAPRALIEAVQSTYENLLWEPLVPRLDAVMAEVRRRQASVADLAPAARISAAYDALAGELARRAL